MTIFKKIKLRQFFGFTTRLLISGFALSLLSSPANAVSEAEVREYWKAKSESWQTLDTQVLERLTVLNDQQWAQFKTTAGKLITPNMGVYYRAYVIEALGELPATILAHEKFAEIAQSLMTEDMRKYYPLKVIKALAIVPAENLFHGKFAETAKSLMTDKMDGSHCLSLIEALGRMPVDLLSHANFVTTLKSLITEDMRQGNRAWMILALGDVPADKADRVYGQTQRLVQETEGKILLQRGDAARALIRQLRDCISDDQAVAFTNDLIARVNGHEGNVNDNAL